MGIHENRGSESEAPPLRGYPHSSCSVERTLSPSTVPSNKANGKVLDEPNAQKMPNGYSTRLTLFWGMGITPNWVQASRQAAAAGPLRQSWSIVPQSCRQRYARSRYPSLSPACL